MKSSQTMKCLFCRQDPYSFIFTSFVLLHSLFSVCGLYKYCTLCACACVCVCMCACVCGGSLSESLIGVILWSVDVTWLGCRIPDIPADWWCVFVSFSVCVFVHSCMLLHQRCFYVCECVCVWAKWSHEQCCSVLSFYTFHRWIPDFSRLNFQTPL